jgi:hypothetical protein
MLSMKDTSDRPDLKDALLNDAALQSMYAEFAQAERQLAEIGLEYYARILDEEETRP